MSETAAELVVVVRGQEIGLSTYLKQLSAGLKKSDAEAEKLAKTTAQKAQQDARAAREGLAHAQAQARLLASSGQTARAIQVLNEALDKVDRSSTAAVRAETQLVNLQKKLVIETHQAETALQRQAQAQGKVAQNGGGLGSLFKGAAGGALEFATSLGIATTAIGAAMAVVDRAKAGFELRATLDEQRRSVGTLLGDVQRGNQVFADAARFGRQYGFTQKDMGESAAAAAPLIRSSTTAVQKQLEVLGRLASLNSQEGFKGAVFSTKELQSGDITSIVERFNLSRKAANEMKQAIAQGADVFQVLDAQLNKMGITVDVLSNRMQGTAGAVRTYAQAQEDLTLAMGRFAEGPGKAVIGVLTDITNRLTSALTVTDQVAGASQQAFSGAQGFQQYGERIQFVNQQLAQLGRNAPQIHGLTEAQFNYAKSLTDTGVAADQATARAQAMSTTLTAIGAVQQQVRDQHELSEQALDRLSNSMLRAAEISPQAAQGAQNLAGAYITNQISVEQLQAALAGLIAHHEAVTQAANAEAAAQQFRAGEHQAGTSAVQDNTAATQANADALVEQLTKSQESAAAAQRLSEAEAMLAQLGATVASGQITAANGALQFANAAGIAYGQALQLINAQAALAKQKVAVQAQQDFRAGERSGGEFRTAAAQKAAADAARAEARAKEEAAAAERRYQQALGNTAPELAYLQGELKKTIKGSAEYFDVLTKIEQLDNKGKKKGGGGAKLSDQQKLDNQLQSEAEKAHAKLEDAELAHTRRLLDIEDDYQRKRREQAKKNELDKRENEIDFLERLTGSDLNKSETGGQEDLARINKQYYADFEAAQKAAQAGQEELSERLLDVAERRAQMELDYAERIDEARAKGDQGEIARLEAIRERRRQLLDEQQKQITENGDANVNARNEQIAAEDQKYLESQDKITTASERAADRKVADAIRSGKAIEAENAKYEKQLNLVNQIAQGGSRPAGASAGGSPAGASSAGAALAAPPGTPLPAGDVIQDATGLIQAIQDAKAAIVGALSDVERAVEGTTSAVQGSGGHIR